MIEETQETIVDWLGKLTDPQVRALASQHKIKGALTEPINILLNALLTLPEVEIQAGIQDGEEVRQA